MGPTSGQICYEISTITLIRHYISAFILLMNFTAIMIALVLIVRIAVSLRTVLLSSFLSNLKRVAYFNAHRSISYTNTVA
ncbi:hypothetical protein MACK_003531 [Theileria orientalis]|uniref:Uncharacterized protein n=1 Tax=Theileria orientalis TaxID=68886 RepID=A0A976SJB8_THEOR|nr:hypothetical protein MACK_003531 [Theileria orientalis]